MVQRIYNLRVEAEEGSLFLFGARQTGKSVFLGQQFGDCIHFDLLDSDLKLRLKKRPSLLFEMLQDKPHGTLIVIDEIPEVPELLNEVHRLIQLKSMRFVLTGSSARKLKRKGYNTLGGRAMPCYFFPFVTAELNDFNLDRALLYGMLPPHYLAKRPQKFLAGYIDIYLKEEIHEEALVRNLNDFQQFLSAAALTSGEIVNFTNIAADCGVSAKTVQAYFSILTDTLIGYMLPSYTKVLKRKVTQSPKFYLFDVGIYNYLLHRTSLAQGTPEYGHALEHFVLQELRAYIGYNYREERLSYWRTYNGKEVDVVVGEAKLGIEIKSTTEIQPRHYANFKEYREEFPESRCVVVSLDPLTRRSGYVEILYLYDFLKMLWKGDLF
ncbi:MAG: DUF4143 domain-containing protein [Paludibacteraceae bacterium]|nr:ATP-binding protein [Candidatus Colousia faecequi]MCQ2338255.1 DUF4143 domain-containing protein [Paludibacteraceae bacterium]